MKPTTAGRNQIARQSSGYLQYWSQRAEQLAFSDGERTQTTENNLKTVTHHVVQWTFIKHDPELFRDTQQLFSARGRFTSSQLTLKPKRGLQTWKN